MTDLLKRDPYRAQMVDEDQAVIYIGPKSWIGNMDVETAVKLERHLNNAHNAALDVLVARLDKIRTHARGSRDLIGDEEGCEVWESRITALIEAALAATEGSDSKERE